MIMTSKCWYMSHNPKNGVKKEMTHIVLTALVRNPRNPRMTVLLNPIIPSCSFLVFSMVLVVLFILNNMLITRKVWFPTLTTLLEFSCPNTDCNPVVVPVVEKYKRSINP